MQYLFDVVLHITDVDTARRALEQNQPAVLHQRKSREQNHNGDAHAHARIGVEPSLVVGLPDHQRGNNDADVVERITDDMNQYAEHSKISAGGREVGNCMTVLGVGAKRLYSALLAHVLWFLAKMPVCLTLSSWSWPWLAPSDSRTELASDA